MVDPTGAGDAYIAGLLAGLRNGASLDVGGRLGSVTASFVVEARGPQGHAFTVSQLRARYQDAFDSELPDAALPAGSCTKRAQRALWDPAAPAANAERRHAAEPRAAPEFGLRRTATSKGKAQL